MSRPSTVAAVDLGSNSFHMIVARVVGADLEIVDRQKEMVRLAAGLDGKGRLSKEALDRVRVFFAWGPDDAEAIRAFPGWPGIPIHATGNPRIDLMRPELRGYFDEDVAALRRRFGDFLLVNTNFALVNHYVESMSGVPPLAPGSHSPEHLEIAGRHGARFANFPEASRHA